MRSGTWLSWIGRRALHAESFALMLSPAIADLQFEAAESPSAMPLHYWAVLRAFAGALWFDISGDLVAMREEVSTIGVLTAIQGSYYTFMLVLLSGFGTSRLSQWQFDESVAMHGAAYFTGIVVTSILTSSACFWPPRRSADDALVD